MPLANGGIAHVNVNWCRPTKIRQMVIGGSHRTLVWDDLNPQQRRQRSTTVAIDLAIQAPPTPTHAAPPRCPTDSATSPCPRCPRQEALSSMVTEFAAAIREQRPPRTDGEAGLRVLSVLEAASASLAARGKPVEPRTTGDSSATGVCA